MLCRSAQILVCARVCTVGPRLPSIAEVRTRGADTTIARPRRLCFWLARGKTTSPKTNEELPHAFLVPNRHLKALCQQFLDEVREVEEAGG